MPLDDADKIKLHEIESHLERDRRMASVFGHRRGPIRRPLSLLVFGATAVFVAALVALSILTADAVPGLLAIVPAAAALLLVRRPRPGLRGCPKRGVPGGRDGPKLPGAGPLGSW